MLDDFKVNGKSYKSRLIIGTGKYKTYKLDDHNSNSLKAEYYKSKLTEKSRKVLVKLKKLKNYGKKNTY